MPSFETVPHLELLAEKLEAVARGELKRLIVIMPPRHGKTEMCSIRFPAWYLGSHPQAQIIGCSYAENLAYSNSYAIRETILGERYQRLWKQSLDVQGSVRWQLAGKENKRSSYIAAGIGGGITGEGADILLIDDPIKNSEEANSPLFRDKQWQWYTTTARTRLQPNGAIIVILTRWHKDDLAGRLLEQAKADPKADQWEVLHLKALTEQPDGTIKVLWPSRYSLEALEAIRANGARDFAALFQGDPVAAEGNIIKREWWKYYRETPNFIRVIQSWDTAFKDKTGADYSVCTTWGETATGCYLLNVWRGKVEFPELKRTAVNLYDRDNPSAVLVEDKASGQSLIQELRRDTKLPVIPVKVDTDKTARVNATSPLIEAGKVFLPESAHWLYDYIEELSAFPAGEHDDQVDSTTQALIRLKTPDPLATWTEAAKLMTQDGNVHE